MQCLCLQFGQLQMKNTIFLYLHSLILILFLFNQNLTWSNRIQQEHTMLFFLRQNI